MAVTRNQKYLDNAGLERVWSKIKAAFVAKESGKGLSTNDYSNEDKAKLNSLGKNLSIGGKTYNGTSAVSVTLTDLSVYSKSEIDSMLSAGMHYEVVAQLPQTGTEGTLYLVPSSTSVTGDVYDEYIWIPTQGSGSSAVEAHFEKIGTTKADLANVVRVGTAGTAVGDSTHPVFINASGEATQGSAYAGGTKVTLNGSNKGANTASFYAPTSAGTDGQYLRSSGNGAPTWETMDTAPTSSSAKAVTSGGVKTYVDGIAADKVNTADYLTDSEIDAICV